MIVFQILIVAISIVCLLSLAACIYCFFSGNELGYSFVRNRMFAKLPLYQRGVLVLSVIALFVCLYNGVCALLFWVPESWGLVDEYGDFTSARHTLSAMFAIFGGLALVEVFSKYASSYWDNQINKMHLDELRLLSDCVRCNASLQMKIKSYEVELDKLSGEYKSRCSSLSELDYDSLYHRKRRVYESLIGVASRYME